MAYQLVFRSPNGEKVIQLDGPIVVGRDPDADVPVDSVRVSRHHAEFMATPQGVTVRDLGSRNGVVVNGTRVEQALIGPSDRVLLGDVAVTVSAGGSAGTRAQMAPPPTPFAAQPAAPMSSGGPPAYPPPAMAPVPPPGQPDPYRGGYVSPGAAVSPPQQPAAAGYGQGWASPAGGMGDKTTVLPRGAMPAGVVPGGVALPAAPAAPAQASLVSKLGGRLTLGARMIIGVLLASTVMFLVTAIPLVQARNEVIYREARARAATIARAVGAENGPALASGQTLALGVQSAVAEPGVREALILSPAGRVLAPAERMDETVAKLGAFGDFGSMQGLQTADMVGEVQAAVVIESNGRRLGVVWVRLDPSYANAGSPVLLYLLAIFATGLAVAAITGVMLKKMVMARLATFATDIDLAASGQLEVVTESFGMPRLAESVNFVIGRLRVAPQQAFQTPPAPAPPPVPLHAQEREGRLVLDASFVVTEATAEAAVLLRTTTERLQGHHVLEAIGEQAMVNALIDAIAGLTTEGSATRRVERPGGGPRLELQARRSAPDGPIDVTIRRLG